MLRRLISNLNLGQWTAPSGSVKKSANRSLTHAARKRWLTFRKCYRAATVRESVPSPILHSFSRSRFGIALGIALVASAPVRAATPSFTVGWSVYVGWNPYYYMAKSGILRKWADEVRNQHPRAALRLRAVAGRVRREEHRRLRDDQHGGAGHAGGGGRGHHGNPGRRLFERQ